MDLITSSGRGPDRRAVVLGGLAAGAAGLWAGVGTAQPAACNTLPNLYPGWNGKEFRDIQANENDHRDAVIARIQALGGTPRPKPTFRNLNPANVVEFATMSRTFENTGTGAGAAVVPVAFSRQVQAFLGSVGLIEARQAGWLNSLFNGVVSLNVFAQDQSFERPLTIQEIQDLTNPFIADLNGGPPPGFAATPSRANDIQILNTLLLLEYLETEFYNTNVPRFFPAPAGTTGGTTGGGGR